jgi:uracil-DNA glycosylase family 4
MGFFSATTLTAKQKGSEFLVPQCQACGLFKTCESPKMPMDGKGKKRILILGEAPGGDEDREGRPFVGKAGKYLKSVLRANGIDMRRDCWITNSIICRPPKNATPTDKQVAFCQPNLVKTLRQIDPVVIIVLGTSAIASIIPMLWQTKRNKKIGGASRWAGFVIHNRKPNAWVCPTFHPSYVHHSENDANGKVVQLLFERHITKAVKMVKKGVPWPDGPPDEKKEIQVIHSPKEAAKEIRVNMAFGGLTAFDFETNMLKPDHHKAEIVSCSICFRGETTIAYPWHGEAIEETRRYLAGSMPKIGANIKFEDRWSRHHLGTPVNNFKWDCVNGAHVIDHRRGITSVKFQSFVLEGTPDYAGHISSYLESEDDTGYGVNRIREIDLTDLLIYNGIDSLVEYRVGIKQAKKLRIPLKG